MESYQAIYDAVRSRIGNGDIGAAVEQAMREANISHYVEMAFNTVQNSANEYARPSVLMRPKIFIDGTQWCALYGDNLQDGVAGFGDSPANAMWDFDRAWGSKLPGQQTLSKADEVLRLHGFPELHKY